MTTDRRPTAAELAYDDACDILTFADTLKARTPRGSAEVDAAMANVIMHLYVLACDAVRRPEESFETYLQAMTLYHQVRKVYRDATR
jgi:hypothetical protein